MKKIFVSILLLYFYFVSNQTLAINYTFTGAGLWSLSSNWDANGIPPNPLLSGDTIIINGSGPTILDINQTIQIGSFLNIISSKTLTINSSTSLVINETNLLNNVGGILNNNGTLSINQAIPNVTQGNLDNRGTLNNNVGAVLNINQAGVLLNLHPNEGLQNDGTVNILGGLYAAHFNNINGKLTNNGILNIDTVGTLLNSGIGTFTNNTSGMIIIHQNGNLGNSGSSSLINLGLLTNNNILTIFTIATLTNNGTLTNNWFIENQNKLINTGIFNNNSGFYNNTQDSLINSGTFNNNGTLDNDGIFINTGTISQNGIFSGEGTFGGNHFINTGILTPGSSPGCMNFSSDFTNTGTLQIDINGATACTQFDQLNITGAATAGGTLAVSFSFVPTIGQSFQIVNAGSFAGNFTTITSSPPLNISYLNGSILVNSILPIKLGSLNIFMLQNDATIYWNATSAVNFSHFEIERSIDGGNFVSVGQKKATNEQGEIKYNYTDVSVAVTYSIYKYVYYRLKMVDMDGKFNYSEIVKISLDKNYTEFTLNVNPNPFTNKINLSLFSFKSGSLDVNIIDIQGRIVTRKMFTITSGFSTIIIDGLGQLFNGMYLLQLKNNSGIITEKLLKL